nr:MAG TPA: hypothetical protein [Crassvirales sp.]
MHTLCDLRRTHVQSVFYYVHNLFNFKVNEKYYTGSSVVIK